jgi:hypothetical protein
MSVFLANDVLALHDGQVFFAAEVGDYASGYLVEHLGRFGAAVELVAVKPLISAMAVRPLRQ